MGHGPCKFEMCSELRQRGNDRGRSQAFGSHPRVFFGFKVLLRLLPECLLWVISGHLSDDQVRRGHTQCRPRCLLSANSRHGSHGGLRTENQSQLLTHHLMVDQLERIG